MNAALKADFLSVEEYLDGEGKSAIRREYINGAIFAMSGATRGHNIIAGNLFAALHRHLGSGPCQVFMVDFKLRVSLAESENFYYPDLLVSCDKRDTASLFNRYPKVVIEVLSESTERIDRVEKFHHYTQIETLEEYVLVDQSELMATVFRRASGWKPEALIGADSTMTLQSLDFAMSLKAIYVGAMLD